MLLALQQCSQLRPRLLCSADAGTPRHGHPRRSRAKSAGRRHRAARVHEAYEARLQVANGRVALRVLRLCARHIPPARSTRRHVIDGYANAVRAASRLEDDDLGAGVLTSLEHPLDGEAGVQPRRHGRVPLGDDSAATAAGTHGRPAVAPRAPPSAAHTRPGPRSPRRSAPASSSSALHFGPWLSASSPPTRLPAGGAVCRNPWHIFSENGWRILTENLHTTTSGNVRFQVLFSKTAGGGPPLHSTT